MERYVKIAAPAGAGALVLSVLIGLISGVSFGTVVVRALAWAALFAGVAVGLAVLIERFIPELVDGDGRPGADRTVTGASTGTRVNIVVEDDEAETTGGSHTNALRATRSADADEAEDAEQRAGPASAELVEAVEERLADDEEAVMSQAIEEERHGAAVDVDGGAIDEMPDIGAFAGSFVSSDYTQTEDASDGGTDDDVSLPDPTSPDGPRPAASGGTKAGNDPAMIARALQTMLKRDGG